MVTIQESATVFNRDESTSSKSPATVVFCLSTDTKPAAPNGSECIETDTGKKFMYDADSSTWIEQ